MLSLRKPDSDKEMFFSPSQKKGRERKGEQLSQDVLSPTNSLCLESMSHTDAEGNVKTQKHPLLRREKEHI